MSPMATAPSRKTILFQIQKKKFGGGKIQKMQRIVFLAGRALPASAISLKIGSSLVVKFHHDHPDVFQTVWFLTFEPELGTFLILLNYDKSKATEY